jgi:pyruvate/2-oxoglutarate dehydrogenase complex dihydrolipoamide dehydrogenase (E3) component
VMAAARASALGAQTVLLASDDFGGMAANDGPVPVRTLAHAARLLRDASQLPRSGAAKIEPQLDYGRVLTRVEDIVGDIRLSSFLLPALTKSGVEY